MNILHEFTGDFEVIDLGIQDVDVYDIEVKDTHNFFGNDILIHNSIYYRIQELVEKKWSHITDKQELVNAIDEYAETVINPYFDKCFEELAVYMNAMRNLLDMKREAIADCFNYF